MGINYYTIGDLVAMPASFLTPAPNPQPVDPTAVTMRVQTPDGGVTDLSASVTKLSVGNYTVSYLVQQLGLHTYEWIGTGAVQQVGIGKFLVNQATF